MILDFKWVFLKSEFFAHENAFFSVTDWPNCFIFGIHTCLYIICVRKSQFFEFLPSIWNISIFAYIISGFPQYSPLTPSRLKKKKKRKQNWKTAFVVTQKIIFRTNRDTFHLKKYHSFKKLNVLSWSYSLIQYGAVAMETGVEIKFQPYIFSLFLSY